MKETDELIGIENRPLAVHAQLAVIASLFPKQSFLASLECLVHSDLRAHGKSIHSVDDGGSGSRLSNRCPGIFTMWNRARAEKDRDG